MSRDEHREPRQPSWTPPRWLLATLIAALAVLAAGLTIRTYQLERQLSELTRPEVNVPIFDLDPGDPLRSAETPARPRLEVPASARYLFLIVPAPGLVSVAEEATGDGLAYDAEILAKNGALIRREHGLRVNGWGSLTLLLPSQILSGGDYTLRLTATGEGTQKAPTELVFTVARNTAPPP